MWHRGFKWALNFATIMQERVSLSDGRGRKSQSGARLQWGVLSGEMLHRDRLIQAIPRQLPPLQKCFDKLEIYLETRQFTRISRTGLNELFFPAKSSTLQPNWEKRSGTAVREEASLGIIGEP